MSTKIDLYDLDNVNQVTTLGEFLLTLDIKSSEELLEICEDAFAENSCNECGDHMDYDCNCPRPQRDYDYEDLYDEDRQR